MMRWSFLPILFLFLCSPAWAQTVMPKGCEQVQWDANSETDLAGYRLYIERDNVADGPVEMAQDETMKLCSELPIITEGHTYDMTITAFDTSGNESAPSNKITVEWPDTAPEVVSGTCVQFENAAGELQCAVAP